MSAALLCSAAALPACANPAHVNLPGAFVAQGPGTAGLQHHNLVNQAGMPVSHFAGAKSAETFSHASFKPLIDFVNSAHSSKAGFTVPQHSLGNTINLSNGVSLDLTSTAANITLGDKLVAAGSSVTIVEGKTSKTLFAGSVVTAAEYIAVKEVLNGAQTLTLDVIGRATGGSVNLNILTSGGNVLQASDLVIATLDSSNPAMFQIVERKLGDIEGIAARFLKSVIKGAARLRGTNFDPGQYNRVHLRVYQNLACYAAIQFLRTETGRDFVRQGMQEVATQYVADAVASAAQHLDASALRFELNEDWVQWHHIQAIFDLESYVPYFYRRIWRIGVNSTGTPLWTSDNPVVLLKLSEEETNYDRRIGLDEYGSCVSFPLSQRDAVLLMYDDRHFSAMSELDGRPVDVPLEFVLALNNAQLHQSRHIVISSIPYEAQSLLPHYQAAVFPFSSAGNKGIM